MLVAWAPSSLVAVFEGAAVFFEKGVAGDHFPDAADLKLIVTAGGGKVLTKLTGNHDRLIVVNKVAKISKMQAASYSSKSMEYKTLTTDEFLAVITEQFGVFETSEAFEGEESGEKGKKLTTNAKATAKKQAALAKKTARTPVTKARTASSKRKVAAKKAPVKKAQPVAKSKTKGGSAPRRLPRAR